MALERAATCDFILPPAPMPMMKKMKKMKKKLVMIMMMKMMANMVMKTKIMMKMKMKTMKTMMEKKMMVKKITKNDMMMVIFAGTTVMISVRVHMLTRLCFVTRSNQQHSLWLLPFILVSSCCATTAGFV